jgi:hypothetical protein
MLRAWYPFYAMKGIKIPVIDVKKYGGKQVAIVNGRVVASAKTLARVIALAKRRAPRAALGDIRVFAVPKTLSVIYYA